MTRLQRVRDSICVEGGRSGLEAALQEAEEEIMKEKSCLPESLIHQPARAAGNGPLGPSGRCDPKKPAMTAFASGGPVMSRQSG
jgi:hypothetical protein